LRGVNGLQYDGNAKALTASLFASILTDFARVNNRQSKKRLETRAKVAKRSIGRPHAHCADSPGFSPLFRLKLVMSADGVAAAFDGVYEAMRAFAGGRGMDAASVIDATARAVAQVVPYLDGGDADSAESVVSRLATIYTTKPKFQALNVGNAVLSAFTGPLLPWAAGHAVPRVGSDDHTVTVAIGCLEAVMRVAAGAAGHAPTLSPPEADWEVLASSVCDTGVSTLVRDRLATLLATAVGAFPVQVRGHAAFTTCCTMLTRRGLSLPCSHLLCSWPVVC